MKLFCSILLAMALFAFGCGYGSNYNSMNSTGGTPQVSQLAPASTASGSAAFMLTINGTGFASDAVVYWNGSTRATTYVTGNQITANISATDVANPATVAVYVHSNGQNSNTVNFTVN